MYRFNDRGKDSEKLPLVMRLGLRIKWVVSGQWYSILSLAATFRFLAHDVYPINAIGDTGVAPGAAYDKYVLLRTPTDRIGFGTLPIRGRP